MNRINSIMQEIKEKSIEASNFLKQLSNPNRLMILCILSQGEHSVSKLIDVVGISQTAMSNHLAKLRKEEIIDYRREHRTLYYYIKNPNVMRIIGVLYDMYCRN